jgi:hypothetical protein
VHVAEGRHAKAKPTKPERKGGRWVPPLDMRDKRVIEYGLQYDAIDSLKSALVGTIEEIRKQHENDASLGVELEGPQV